MQQNSAQTQTAKPHRYIDSEKDLIDYLSDIQKRNIGRIALDMEGDQGSIRYRYSISVFQCFDGKEAVIIDVLKTGNAAALRDLLTDSAITKVMFSCANDLFMTQNILGCTISPVRDIAIGQKLLNLPINISDHLNIDKKLKDKYQRANWLKRPINPVLLEYAINDVVDLLTVEQSIAERLHAENKFDAYTQQCVALTKKDFTIDHMLHYRAKFPGYKRLRPAQRRAAAAVWVFRELMGNHFDCPVGYILSKQAMMSCIRDPDHAVTCLEMELNRGRNAENRLKKGLIEKLYKEAYTLTEDHFRPLRKP